VRIQAFKSDLRHDAGQAGAFFLLVDKKQNTQGGGPFAFARASMHGGFNNNRF
jgi:hypothetical protein